MADIIRIEKIDEVYMKVLAEPDIRRELYDHFAFRANNYQFNPKYKAKVWDGYIRLYNPMKPLLYTGLFEYLKKFCSDRNYVLEYNTEDFLSTEIPDSYPEELAKETSFELRDYQKQYVLNALRSNRSLSLSPTSSGKSFIIYLIQQHYYKTFGHKTLIIVPTVGLVYQMANDFISYGCNEDQLHTIKGGVEKNTSKNIVISTWQSLINMDKTWFDKFDVVLGDEAHLFQAKSLREIMEKMTEAKYRHSFTGTISSDSKVNKIILEGLFGPIKRFVTTAELIEKKIVADFNIKGLILKYNDELKTSFIKGLKEEKKKKPNQKNIVYTYERDFIFKNEKRNKFLRNLIVSLENKNNLILFDQIEKHGNILKDLLEIDGRILHYIHGDTPGEERERIRQLIENDPLKQHNILASYGVFSTGVSIKRIDTAIFASGYKGEIKVLQSIGRTLRRGNGSDDAILYDIADDLCVGSFTNYTLKHFKARLDIYGKEQFNFKIYNIDL